MDDLASRVTRLQRAAWRLRATSPVRCVLPFALALMTDERRHLDLVSLIERLPAGPPVLVVFRHYGLAPEDRRRLAEAAYAAARARGHLLVAAGGGGVGDGLAGDGAHNAAHPGLRTVSVHSGAEAMGKRGLRADLAFVSPVFGTRSHPGARALGPVRAAALARGLPMPAFALGGMDESAARRLEGTAFTGVGAIGAFGA